MRAEMSVTQSTFAPLTMKRLLLTLLRVVFTTVYFSLISVYADLGPHILLKIRNVLQ